MYVESCDISIVAWALLLPCQKPFCALFLRGKLIKYNILKGDVVIVDVVAHDNIKRLNISKQHLIHSSNLSTLRKTLSNHQTTSYALLKCKINFTIVSKINFNSKQSNGMKTFSIATRAHLKQKTEWNVCRFSFCFVCLLRLLAYVPVEISFLSDDLIKLNINLLLSWWYRNVIKAHPPEISFWVFFRVPLDWNWFVRNFLSLSLERMFVCTLFYRLNRNKRQKNFSRNFVSSFFFWNSRVSIKKRAIDMRRNERTKKKKTNRLRFSSSNKLFIHPRRMEMEGEEEDEKKIKSHF